MENDQGIKVDNGGGNLAMPISNNVNLSIYASNSEQNGTGQDNAYAYFVNKSTFHFATKGYVANSGHDGYALIFGY